MVGAAAVPVYFAFERTVVAGAGFGPLVEDPEGIIDLPEGFSYAILEKKTELMDDGYKVPGRPDGMACFDGPDGTLILMRNHENSPGDFTNGPYRDGQIAPPQTYAPLSMGGVSRLVLDAATFERISSNLVLVGTNRNCAGGVSPWGWLSCEENTSPNHGYTFLCSIDAEVVQDPQPIKAYGRCNHEAAAVDPNTHICYLTEDRGNSSFYRFVPFDKGTPFEGTLQGLRVVGDDQYSTTSMQVGDIVDIDWVDIDEPDPLDDSLRSQAQAKGAAVFIRAEGLWIRDSEIYICSTSGGPLSAGQIFRLIDDDQPTLELVAMSTDRDVLDNPDNITVAPCGSLFLAEDGAGEQFIRGLTVTGELFNFARNAVSSSEFAGVCFSSDGRAMFVNIQNDGLTLVITGPFLAGACGANLDPACASSSGGDGSSGSSGASGMGETEGPGGSTSSATEPTSMGSSTTVGDVGPRGVPVFPRDSAGCECSSEPAGADVLLTATTLAAAALVKRRAHRERNPDSDSE